MWPRVQALASYFRKIRSGAPEHLIEISSLKERGLQVTITVPYHGISIPLHGDTHIVYTNFGAT